MLLILLVNLLLQTKIKALVAKVFSRENLQEDKLNTFEEYIEFAKLNIIEKKFDKAIEALRIAISKEPGLPDTHNLLGVIEEYKGNVDEAQKYYRAALALDPSYDQLIVILIELQN